MSVDDTRATSLWSADPLSWLATRWLVLGCALAAFLQAATLLVFLGDLGDRPFVQVIAFLVSISAFLLVHVTTRIPNGALRESVTWSALAIVLAGTGLSAAGYVGVDFRVEFWWAPVSVSLLIIALMPFSTVAQLARLGLVATIVCGGLAAGLAAGGTLRWSFFVTIYFVVLQLVVATVGCMVFVRVVTRLFQSWNERPLAPAGDPDRVASPSRAELVDRVDAAMAARLAGPLTFLREVLDRGVVDPADQERALALATELRAELVVGAQSTWLDRVTAGQPLHVVDPERLAGRLSLPQRSALRAMLDALLAHPDSGFVEGRVELKSADRGTVAVALRIVTTLAEGRRETFLAPYYVTLQAAVSDIRWRNGAALEVDFQVPLEDAGHRPIVQRSPAPDPLRPPTA